MVKIKDAIRRDITSGKYAENGRLPGVRELALRYDCSRGTISNALKELSDQGFVRTEHGRGTFLADGGLMSQRRSTRMVGAALLRHSWMEHMESLRDEYLRDGWFISLYCSSDDMQNPEAERHFLELALAQDFAGVILTGTPLEPLNSDLYLSLRQAGMKIVHLTHYKEDMSGEATILPDYRMAGAMACSVAAARHKKRFAIVRMEGCYPPSTALRMAGARTMNCALGMEQLPDLILADDVRITPDVEARLFQFFKKYAPASDLALLVDDCATLRDLQLWMKKNGVPEEQQPFMISMSDTHWAKNEMNYIGFDYEQSLRLAMEYITDEKIKPLDPFHRVLSPELHLTTMQFKHNN